MDKWEEIGQKMMAMSPEERKKRMDELRDMCICGGCPTYADCNKQKMQFLFCSEGKSDCRMTQKGCLCPTCPVTPIRGLTKSYYCIRGNEKTQRGK